MTPVQRQARRNLVGAGVAMVAGGAILANKKTKAKHPSPTRDISGDVSDIEKDYSKGRINKRQRSAQIRAVGGVPGPAPDYN